MMVRKGVALVVVLGLVACGSESTAPPRPIASESAEPSLLKITCHDDGSTELHTPTVAAQADGVHVQVDNRTGEGVSMNGLGWDFSKGTTEEVLSVEPGSVHVACWPYSRHGGPEPDTVALQIVDPAGHWIPRELECPPDSMIAESISDFAGGSPGTKGDPIEIVRNQLKGLEPDDVVERAAYPEQKEPLIRVVREGKVIGLATLSTTEQGGYLFGGFSACDQAGLRQH